MKLFKKILPISTIAIAATFPAFLATSCSNVYIDLLSKRFVPSGETPLEVEGNELAASEAEQAYYDYFKNHKGQLGGDANWGSSIYARVAHSKLFPLSKFETLLHHFYSFDVKEDTTKHTHRLSYSFKTQFRLRDKTEQTTTGTSYSINTYDIKFDFNNIECYPWYNGEVKDVDGKTYYLWSLCPNKYNIARGRWYQELEGNEKIKFEIKAVYKGYSENGAQNYVKEINESAIIDQQHKYVPELNETLTEMMLITPYYISNITPRMWLTKTDGYPTYITNDSSGYTATAKFDFGSKTQELEDKAIKLTVDPVCYVYSPTESGGKLVENGITVDDEIQIASTSQSANIKFNFEKQPNVGDIVYYCVIATHAPTSNDDYDWREWFTVSSIVS